MSVLPHFTCVVMDVLSNARSQHCMQGTAEQSQGVNILLPLGEHLLSAVVCPLSFRKGSGTFNVTLLMMKGRPRLFLLDSVTL